jgi:hypothetical protein
MPDSLVVGVFVTSHSTLRVVTWSRNHATRRILDGSHDASVDCLSEKRLSGADPLLCRCRRLTQ